MRSYQSRDRKGATERNLGIGSIIPVSKAALFVIHCTGGYCPGRAGHGILPNMFGSHLSIAGGLHLALEKAHAHGMKTVQVFTKN